MERQLTLGHIAAFQAQLLGRERCPGTVENYLRHAKAFGRWLQGRPVTRELVASWKNHLLAKGNHPATVNAKLGSVNQLLACAGWEDCCVKLLRLQRKLFRETARELTRAEYVRLIAAAQRAGRERLALLIETICATGIRVSEVRYITLEAVRQGRAEIALKGKIRTILIPRKLARKLEKYARRQKTASGEIFLTRSGKSLNRRQIWAEMKALCQAAKVAPSKVFPHNLRHLFARCFYRATRDIAKLADILGHSSVETTRIYLISTGAEHARLLEGLRLVE